MISGHQIIGAGEFLRIKIQAQALDNKLRSAVQGVARKYRDEVRRELQAQKSGKAYSGSFRFGRGKRRASAPGQAPGDWSGALMRSLRTRYRQDGYGARIFAHRKTAFYRHMLEFGTADRPRIRRKRERIGRVTERGRNFGRSIWRMLSASDRGSTGRVLPRPLWSPLQARMTDDVEKAVQKAVDDFGAP